MTFLPTLILRHRKENRKKCSLTPLEKHPDFLFFTYPKDPLIDLSSYVLLSLEGEPLSENDRDRGICLIDATWRYAKLMQEWILTKQNIPLRTLPRLAMSAYPRKQTACADPQRGLASIEALYLAYQVVKRENKNLLDHYFWKEGFLQKNADLLTML